MKVTWFFAILIFVSMVSCDAIVGIDGIVTNGSNGEKLEGVKVTMNSSYEEIESTTDTNGFFSTEQIYGCGIRKCDESYTLTFEKRGFIGLVFNERSVTQYIVGDTFVIAMDSLKVDIIDICCE